MVSYQQEISPKLNHMKDEPDVKLLNNTFVNAVKAAKIKFQSKTTAIMNKPSTSTKTLMMTRSTLTDKYSRNTGQFIRMSIPIIQMR